MKKITLQTPNITAQNIDKIAELFPNCITETKGENGTLKKAVNFDVLKQILSEDVVEGSEAYEFTWVGKRAATVEAFKSINKTLRPCPDESVDWDNTQNLYIEGDNLEVLKLLQENYLKKVKMIYIDPPYNTGNDFIYKDDFRMTAEEWDEESGAVDEEGNRLVTNSPSNGRFHSDWCSMIYSRLLLARGLLTDDGVIFISIDDNEQENLKKICDEVFGANNFVAQLVWEKKKKGAFLSKNYINMKEYILVYSKNNTLFNGLIGEVATDMETYPCIKTTNARGIRIIRKGVPSKYNERNYKIKANTRISSGNMELVYLDELNVKNGILQKDVRIDSNWIYSQEALDQFAEKGLIYITQDNYIRRIVNDERIKMLKDLLTRVGVDGESLPVYKFDKNLNNGGWGTNEDANDELHKLLQQQYVFDFAKPTRLIAKLIQSTTNPGDLVLDFFSGSATTAHAVMQLNAEDGGNRRFIMVQIPEVCDEDSEAFKAGYSNICDIGKERIRRAGAKIKESIAQEDTLFSSDAPELDTGFRVFKVAESNMNDVDIQLSMYSQDMLDQMVDNIKEDRTALDLLFGCALEWGLELTMPYTSEQIDGCTVHTYSQGESVDLIACFDKDVPESTFRAIAARKPLRVVFRDSCFKDCPSKINAEELIKTLSPKTDVRVL